MSNLNEFREHFVQATEQNDRNGCQLRERITSGLFRIGTTKQKTILVEGENTLNKTQQRVLSKVGLQTQPTDNSRHEKYCL